MTKGFFDSGHFFASPAGFCRADEGPPVLLSGAKRRMLIFRGFRWAKPNPTPGETPTLRHSGLDPESRIVNFRREAPLLRAGEHSSPLHCFTKGWEKGHSLENFD
jgi:hypothetical protein